MEGEGKTQGGSGDAADEGRIRKMSSFAPFVLPSSNRSLLVGQFRQ